MSDTPVAKRARGQRIFDCETARAALIATADDLADHGQHELAKHYYNAAANTNKHVLAALRRMML